MADLTLDRGGMQADLLEMARHADFTVTEFMGYLRQRGLDYYNLISFRNQCRAFAAELGREEGEQR